MLLLLHNDDQNKPANGYCYKFVYYSVSQDERNAIPLNFI